MLRRKFVGSIIAAVGISGCLEWGNAPRNTEQSEATDWNSTKRTPHSPTETSVPTSPNRIDSEPTSTSTPADQSDSEINPVPPYQGQFIDSGRKLDNFEDVSHWSGDIRQDTDRSFSGSQSLQLHSTSGEATAIADYSDDPLDLREADLSFACYQDLPDGQPSMFVDLFAPDADNRLQFKWVYHGYKDLGWQRVDIAPFETVGNPDLSAVEKVRITLNASKIRVWIDDFRAHPAPDAGKIILRFDDAHEHHYTDYFPLLSEYGYPGIEAVVLNSVGQRDRLSVAQMQEMQSDGWEMLSHTVGHDDVTKLSEVELRKNQETMKEWLTENGFERSSAYFVYPFNHYDGKSLSVLNDYVDLGFAGGGLGNVAVTNPLTIASVDAEESTARPLEAIDRAAKHRQLLVLMFHTIDTGQLKKILDHIRDKGDRLDVINASQLQEEFSRLHSQ
ncbi:polysaccharide deacetylase family protein [Halocatena marina]|uniref:polysaccharide deacetylase family protein n=1 Tax=Halocatena marina TaxID=2934937 RepID=UPI00200E4CB8|nr:polysaccharide deacetylase family protein [Halocatena marina]